MPLFNAADSECHTVTDSDDETTETRAWGQGNIMVTLDP